MGKRIDLLILLRINKWNLSWLECEIKRWFFIFERTWPKKWFGFSTNVIEKNRWSREFQRKLGRTKLNFVQIRRIIDRQWTNSKKNVESIRSSWFRWVREEFSLNVVRDEPNENIFPNDRDESNSSISTAKREFFG